MAGFTNPFLSHYESRNEQQLMQDLNDEAIECFGEDMFYLPRILQNYDPIRGEDDQSTYVGSYQIPVYIESYDKFQGDGSFISKFAGLEIRDQVFFGVSMKTFAEEVGVNTGQSRPNEGDIIYFPLNNKCFQIRFVDKFEMFYPLGALYVWRLQCELFEYSGEKFNTGIPEIDSINLLTTSEEDQSIRDTSNSVITDPSGEGITWSNTVPGIDESADFTNAAFSETSTQPDDPFSENYFASNTS